jgi:rSAM/selenodomain-associated transferase 1
MNIEINPGKDCAILGIFAKQPTAGLAKTRLAKATNAEWAQTFAKACLEDSLDRFHEISVPQVTQFVSTIVFTPADADAYFAALSGDRFQLLPQCDGDLGQRLQSFFEYAHDHWFGRAVVVGTDSPTLPIPIVEEAFRALETHDIVIGPACDGGYYLIGLGPRRFPIFRDVPWGTSGVLEETVAQVQRAGARLALLPPWYDVDTVDDWAFLRGHILAMRRAGMDPGVPRIERLIGETPSWPKG